MYAYSLVLQELGIIVYHFGGAQGDGEETVLACVPLFKAKQVLSSSLLVSSLPMFGEINLVFGAVRAPRRMCESEKSREEAKTEHEKKRLRGRTREGRGN